MKILYLCNEITRKSGWGVVNYYTIKGAVEKGHDVTVFTQKAAANEEVAGARIIPTLFRVGQTFQDKNLLLSSFLCLRKSLKQESYDVVHVLVEPYIIFFSILSHPNLVFSLVGTYAISIFKNSKLALLNRLALRKVKRYIAISKYTADFFQKTILNAPVEVVPLGVDLSIYKRKFNPNLPKSTSFVLVGEIKERKGVIFALKAIERLAPKFPTIKLNIVGSDEGPYAKICKDYVSSNHLEKNIEFLGRLSHSKVVGLYEKAIGNILPSVNAKDGSFEGFGLIHLEANACSVLTIGSKNCGNESAIINGETGFLVEQKNDLELSNKMEQIISIKENNEYSKYADRCYNYALTQSWDKYFEKIEPLYS